MTSVYFAASGGRIKIGTTSRSVGSRLKHISHSLPDELELIGRIPGDTRMERAVQRYLVEWNLKGEWFQDCEIVRRKIWQIIADGPEALGIRPIVPCVETKDAPIPPKDEYKILFPGLVRLVWPNDPLRQLIAFTEYPEGECEKWLAGQEEPPRLVRYAFSAVVAICIRSDKNKQYAAQIDFLKQEVA